MAHSWIFNSSSEIEPHYNIEQMGGVVYMVYFDYWSNHGQRRMGYVQFLAKKSIDQLRSKYPFCEWFESVNDPTIYREYETAKMAIAAPTIRGYPRPKNRVKSLFPNPISAAKKKIKQLVRDELREAALSLLKDV